MVGVFTLGRGCHCCCCCCWWHKGPGLTKARGGNLGHSLDFASQQSSLWLCDFRCVYVRMREMALRSEHDPHSFRIHSAGLYIFYFLPFRSRLQGQTDHYTGTGTHRLCFEELDGCKSPVPATLTHPWLFHCAVPWCFPPLVCPYIMLVRAVPERIPSRISSGVSSVQGYPSPLAERCLIPMGTLWLISIFTSQAQAPVSAAALDVHAEQRTPWIEGKKKKRKGKVAKTIKSSHWSRKHIVISLQKSHNGCKHNNKVALFTQIGSVWREEAAVLLTSHSDAHRVVLFDSSLVET